MIDMDKLFEEFMTAFHRKPIVGFEQVSDPEKMLTSILHSDKLITDFDVFLQTGTASLIAFWNLPDSRPVVYFNSDGSPFSVIAKNFEEFLSLLYLGTYALIEIDDHASYLDRKSRNARLGFGFVGEEPTGMLQEEIENYENELKAEYEDDYDEVISWLRNHGIERPKSFHDQIINAYKESRNLQDFLDEKLGTV
ncbi:hypothetical protein D3C87_86080 [compost metagenome]